MPSITSWTKLEPQTRNAQLKTSVQARIHDPLWLLARQWQVGEFQGEDSGTPIMARLRADVSRLTRFFAGPIAPNTQVSAAAYDPKATALETMVERERVRPLPAEKGEKLRFAVEAAQQFFRLLDQQRQITPAKLAKYRAAFTRKFPFAALTAEERTTLDNDSLRFFDLISTRVPDGRLLYSGLRAALGPPGMGALPADLQVTAADAPKVNKAVKAFLQWYETLFTEPADAPASWVPDRLEYAFSVATRLSDHECTLTANEYFDGHLDWEDFGINIEVSIGAANDNAITQTVTTVIPAPVRFRGAPASRFWEFEDAQVDYGRIPTGPADLPHLLLIEFANSFGNDWFVIPVDLEIGSLCRTRSLVVTDTFGVRTLIKSSSESGLPHSLWRMFQLSHQRPSDTPPPAPASNLFFLPPALAKTIEAQPVEEVILLRDEMANVAWAVERRIESPLEQSVNRYEAQADASQPIVPTDGVPVYRIASQVPEYWAPLLPVQTDLATRAVRLVRGAVLKANGSQQVVRALGRILNPDGSPPLALYEEEVPREGARVTRNYQLARWLDGSTHLWMGRRKQVGRGEGSSGLRFDTADGG
jgi:hypothetical protein